MLDRPDVQRVWHPFTHHEFVEGMGQGTLPVERFKEYLVQDYLYLVCNLLQDREIHGSNEISQIQFARSNALAAYKSQDMDSIAAVNN